MVAVNPRPNGLQEANIIWGKQSRLNMLLRTSSNKLLATNIRNEHEKSRCNLWIKRIEDKEKAIEQKSQRELTNVRDNIREMIASRKVYKQHSFCKYDTNLKATSDKTVNTQKEEQKGAPETKPFRQEYSFFIVAHAAMPQNNDPFHIRTPLQEWNPSKVRYQPGPHSKIVPNVPFSNQNSHKTVKPKIPFSGHAVSLPQLDKNKMKSVQSYDPSSTDTDAQKGHWRKLFPGESCSRFGIRQFMEDEKRHILWTWSAEAVRKRKTKKLLQTIQPLTFVERSKTTSAIFRDYDEYKHQQEDRNQLSDRNRKQKVDVK